VPEAGERIVKLFPALLAGGLALVYVLGALVTGSAFEGAGIDPRDAVPLLSLEQVLARGIGVLVAPSTFLLLLAFAVSVLNGYALGRWRGKLLTQGGRPRPSDSRSEKKALVGAFAVTGCVILFIVPLNQLPGLAIALVAFMIATFITAFGPDGRRSGKMTSTAVVVIGIVLGLMVNAYTDPTPSAKVELEVRGRSEPVAGILVTHSNSTWYVFSEVTEKISAYSDDTVAVATIDKRPSGESNDDLNLIGHAWDGIQTISPF
jgi:hypothetical protein